MLKIVQAPHPALSAQAKKITKIDKPLHDLIHEMTIALTHAKDPEGIGLAAPQVGKPLQLFIIKESPEAELKVFINPTLTILEKFVEEPEKKTKSKKNVKLEGCLSLQDIWGIVKRHPAISLTYLDEKGTEHSRKFTGFYATIVQHEYDHLQGTLFPKRVLEQGGQLYKSVKDKKGETIFEEIEL